MRQSKALVTAAIALIAVTMFGRLAIACPFCSAASQTFSEELATMDVAVIAKLVKLPPQSNKPGDDIQKATFEVTQVVKGEGLVKAKEKLETLYFGDGTILQCHSSAVVLRKDVLEGFAVDAGPARVLVEERAVVRGWFDLSRLRGVDRAQIRRRQKAFIN